jgi:hypothetical protein
VSGPVVVSGVRPARSIEQELLAELKAAHRLLSVALGCMSTASKAEFARKSETLGFGEDGATRHHERAALIARVERRAQLATGGPYPPAAGTEGGAA